MEIHVSCAVEPCLISHFNIITMSDAYKTENPTVNCHILKLILILSRCKCAL